MFVFHTSVSHLRWLDPPNLRSDDFSELEENEETTIHSMSTIAPETETPEVPNWRARGFKRKRIKGGRRTTTDAPGTSASS